MIVIFNSCSLSQTDENQASNVQDSESFATSFEIVNEQDYTLLQSKNAWIDNSPTYQYLLYPNTLPEASKYPEAVKIKTPINSALCLSTTHVAYLSILGDQNIIKGLSGTSFLYDDLLREKASKGDIREIGSSADLNYELILELNPDVIFLYTLGDASVYKQLIELGQTPIMVNDFAESHPLGRAEWIHFFASFTGKETLAEEVFNKMKTDYLQVSDQVKTLPKPSVFTGMGFEGVWYVPGKGNYMAQFIEDAGGNYIWKDRKEQGSIALDFEAMYERSFQADFWFNTGIAKTKKDILEADKRYTDFKAYQEGNMFNSNKRISPNGGYDFYESAVVHPDLVLKDLIKILHPDQLPDHDFVYYRQIE